MTEDRRVRNAHIPLALLVAAALLSFAACSSSAVDETPPHHDGPPPAAESQPEHGLTLDGEAKWEMDEHTRSVFAVMAGRFDDLDVETAEPGVLADSGTKLRADIDTLIQGCTMTGDAHNELHKYLVLYIPAVTALAADGNRESGREVKHLLTLYTDYFE